MFARLLIEWCNNMSRSCVEFARNRVRLEGGRDRKRKENKEIEENKHPSLGFVSWWAAGYFSAQSKRKGNNGPFGV